MNVEFLKLEPYLGHVIKLAIEYLPKLALALVVLFGGLWIVEKLTIGIQKGLERKELDVSLRSFLGSMFSILLKVLLLVTVAGMIGIQTTSFVAILGAAGLAVGLALQGSLSNFAGGVLILVFKPYKVGDTIEALGQVGKVKEILIFNTVLVTGDNKNVTLPNGALANGTIVNQNKENYLTSTMVFPVVLGSDFEEIKSLILGRIASSEVILKTPAPAVKIKQINPAHIQVMVVFHAENARILAANSAIQELVYQLSFEKKFEIASV